MRSPLSLDAFAGWCERQPPRLEYRYFNGLGCAWAQYLRWLGFALGPIDGEGTVRVAGAGWWQVKDGAEVFHAFPPGVAAAICRQPHNFGALAARLRVAIAIE